MLSGFFNGFFTQSEKKDSAFIAKAVTYIGNCGDNVKWTLNLKIGTLTIEGSGDTFDYEEKENPWYKYRDSINKVIVEDKVTSIGQHFFSYLDSVNTVKLSKSVKAIKAYAFYACTSLSSVKSDNSKLKSIGENAFAYCRKLYSLPSFPKLVTVGKRAFYYCFSLPEISLAYTVNTVGEDAFAYCTSLKKIRIVNYSCDIYDGEKTIFKNTVIERFNESTAKKYADKYNHKFSKIKDIKYINDLKLTPEYVAVSYDGKKKTPSVHIKGLKSGRDFDLKYKNNKEPGVAEITANALGDTLGEKSVTFKINPPPPNSPKLKSRTDSSLSFSWNKVHGADKYEVYQKIKGEWKKVGETAKTEYKASSLSGATEYSFKVRAVTKSGKTVCKGHFSSVFSDFTKPEPTVISKVSLVRGGGKLKVNVSKVSGADGYEILMATKENGKYKTVAVLNSASKTSVVVDGLSNSHTYYFKARTFMKNGDKTVYSTVSDIVSSNVL